MSELTSTIKLNNGVEMPRLGFGVFQVDDLKLCEQAVSNALATGYRLIDTAATYNNEAAVGAAIRKSGIDRKEIFVTSKAFIHQMGYERTKAAFNDSLEKLGLDYIDLYLVHMPFGDYYGSWRAMTEFYKEGKVRALGVSNFLPDRILDFCLNRDIEVKPALNQLEIHPFYQRPDEIKLLQEQGIVPQAWAPFAEGMNGMFTNPVLQAIAQKHGKSVAQVILRWNLQRGVCVIPKSVHQNRMAENFAVWDFALSAEDMQAIAALDLKRPQMVDTLKPSEVHRLYDYVNNPVLTSL